MVEAQKGVQSETRGYLCCPQHVYRTRGNLETSAYPTPCSPELESQSGLCSSLFTPEYSARVDLCCTPSIPTRIDDPVKSWYILLSSDSNQHDDNTHITVSRAPFPPIPLRREPASPHTCAIDASTCYCLRSPHTFYYSTIALAADTCRPACAWCRGSRARRADTGNV